MLLVLVALYVQEINPVFWVSAMLVCFLGFP